MPTGILAIESHYRPYFEAYLKTGANQLIPFRKKEDGTAYLAATCRTEAYHVKNFLVEKHGKNFGKLSFSITGKGILISKNKGNKKTIIPVEVIIGDNLPLLTAFITLINTGYIQHIRLLKISPEVIEVITPQLEELDKIKITGDSIEV